MFCTRCGTANTDEAMFCVNCNAPLTRRTTPQGRRDIPRRDDPQPEPEYSLPAFPDPPRSPDLPYPGYQSSYQMPPHATGSASGRAIASMILSLGALVTCGPLMSIPGLILGKQEIDAIKAGRAPVAGETFAKIGYYGGIAVTALSCLWMIPVAFYWMTIGL